MIGVPELAVVAALILLLFGHRFIPKLARAVAQTPVEFVRGRRED